MADERPWSAAAALTLAGWPVLAAPLVDALAESDDLTVPADVVDALAVELAGRMWQVAQASARITAHEAADQGVTGTATADRGRIDQHAATFAGLIASGYAAAAVQASLGVPLTEAGPFRAAAAKVKAAVRAALNALGVAVHGLVPTHVGAAMASAETEGRRAFYEAHPPRYLVAAEIHEIDRCLPCTEINGTRYTSLDEALADYPTVGYRACKGGIRCRGRLRGVWSDDPAEPRPVVPVVEADAPVRTGAMLALVPSAVDAARLAEDGGEDPDELHLTLAYLGKADAFDAAGWQRVMDELTAATRGMPKVVGHAFAPAPFNPTSDEPCRVLIVGGDQLDGVHHFLMDVLHLPPVIDRHAPWVPHITVAYDGDFGRLRGMVDRLGAITFDRVRLAIAGQYLDIPLVDVDEDDEGDDEQPDGDWALAEAADRNNLRTYFTTNPKGLKRWAGKPHPWTALFKILRKHLDPERAKRVTSAWYLRVFHHTPNQHIAEALAGRVTLTEFAGGGHPDSCSTAHLATLCKCGCNGTQHGEHTARARLGSVKTDRIDREGGLVRLQAMSDDELASTFAAYSRDGQWDRFEEVAAEMDRREHANDWLEPPPADTHWDVNDGEPTEEDRRVDALVARGYDYAEAFAEVFGGDAEKMRREERTSAVDRRDGETLDAAVRRSYDEMVHEQYLRADADTRGNLLTKEAEAAGMNPVDLFSGPTARARKNASEDLQRWWADNGGRTTFTQYRAQVLGRDRDKAAAELTRLGANGKDFV